MVGPLEPRSGIESALALAAGRHLGEEEDSAPAPIDEQPLCHRVDSRKRPGESSQCSASRRLRTSCHGDEESLCLLATQVTQGSSSSSGAGGGLRRCRSSKSLLAPTVLVVDACEGSRAATVSCVQRSAAASLVSVSFQTAASVAEATRMVATEPRPRLVLIRRDDGSASSPHSTLNLWRENGLPAVVALVDASTDDDYRGDDALGRRTRRPSVPLDLNRAFLDDGFDEVAAAPLSMTKANELLWHYVAPVVCVKISAQKPVSSLLRDLGAAVAAPLRDGGLRGLLALLHKPRLAAGRHLDELVERRRGETMLASRGPAANFPAENRRIAVLVVDDSAVIRERHVSGVHAALGRAKIGDCGDDVDVVAAADGFEACDAIVHPAHCFVLCLVDLKMPAIGGTETARALRSRGATAGLVAVTSSVVPASDNDEDDDTLALVFDDVIRKPLHSDDADSLVNRWITPRVDELRAMRSKIPDVPSSDDVGLCYDASSSSMASSIGSHPSSGRMSLGSNDEPCDLPHFPPGFPVFV